MLKVGLFLCSAITVFTKDTAVHILAAGYKACKKYVLVFFLLLASEASPEFRAKRERRDEMRDREEKV